MKRLRLALYWYLSSVATLLFTSLFLLYVSYPRQAQVIPSQKFQSYQAIPTSLATQEVFISSTDARPALVYNFFKQFRSPLADFSDQFIEMADQHNLDFRLLPAIAMQESNGGKIMPNNSYNPFGYGIYGKYVIRFSSFSEAIETVAKGLRKDYLNLGLTTPQQIMTKYTPSSLAKGGSWALGVSAFIEQIR